MNLRPKAALTEADVKRGLRLVIGDGLTTETMTALITGAFLVSFALMMGANNFQIGLLAALNQAMNFSALLDSPSPARLVTLAPSSTREPQRRTLRCLLKHERVTSITRNTSRFLRGHRRQLCWLIPVAAPSKAKASLSTHIVSDSQHFQSTGPGPNNSFKPSPLRGFGQNPPFSGGPA